MRAVGASTRIFSLIDRNPNISPSHPNAIAAEQSRRGVLKFENVGSIPFILIDLMVRKISFHYPSRQDVQVLKDFNLEIGVGESVAVVWVILAWSLRC